MDEEDKQLLKQLSEIMREIEQKGLLKEIDDEQRNELLPNENENDVDIWKHIYDGDEGFPFTMNKGQPLGGTLCFEIQKNKKKSVFFRELSQLLFVDEPKGVVKGKRKGYIEALGLIRTETLLAQDMKPLYPKPLPKKTREQTENSTYIVCRIVYSGKRANRQLKIYFSKEWSKVIRNSPTFIDTNLIEINDLWMLNKKEANLMLPCKALCRLEGRELLINVPPWLSLAFSTQKNEAQTNIWISYYSETSGRIVRGYLSKKGKTFSHYRCSRKKPWDFYTTMIGEMKGDTKKTIDFMISFTPEAAFQSSNVQ